MARFDVHRLAGASGFVVDCQTNLLASLDTRFVLPLRRFSSGEFRADPRLHPILAFAGAPHILVASLALTVATRRLGRAVGSLGSEEYKVIAAIDYLLTGV